MNAIEEDVKRLVGKELESANKRFPAFRSEHEGWAVLHEEADELEAESDKILMLVLDEMWESVKSNTGTREYAREIQSRAVSAACEAIQVAAMARKYLDYLAVEDE